MAITNRENAVHSEGGDLSGGHGLIEGKRRSAFQRAVSRAIVNIEEVSAAVSPAMDALARVAESRAGARSKRLCLRYVNNAIQAVGIKQHRDPRAIESVGTFRRNSAFVEIENVTRENLHLLPRGCVVITANPRGGAGHAQVMLGDGRAVSDFKHGLNIYKSATRFYAFVPRKDLQVSLRESLFDNSVVPEIEKGMRCAISDAGVIFLFQAGMAATLNEQLEGSKKKNERQRELMERELARMRAHEQEGKV